MVHTASQSLALVPFLINTSLLLELDRDLMLQVTPVDLAANAGNNIHIPAASQPSCEIVAADEGELAVLHAGFSSNLCYR